MPISQEEIKRIKKYIKANNIPINNPNSILTGYVDQCSFVNAEGRCAIYPVHPEVCSYYSCHTAKEYHPSNHINKNIRHMLLTFDPDAYCPKDPSEVKIIDLLYQAKKKNLKDAIL